MLKRKLKGLLFIDLYLNTIIFTLESDDDDNMQNINAFANRIYRNNVHYASS